MLILIILLILTIVLLLNKPIEKYSNISNKICLIYAYFEKNKNYKENLEYFLNNKGIFPEIDYYIIINGISTINIPKNENITIYERDNIGYDFGAYSYALKKINKEYDYYFFMNTSVRGPFLDSGHQDKNWYQYFLELFNNNVKVVVTTINILDNNLGLSNFDLKKIYNKDPPYTHVQSMFFCIDNEYLSYLNKIDFFNETECNENDISYIVDYKEIGLSQIALKNNWNINCILSKYKNLDYINLKYLENCMGDPVFKNKYCGGTIDKYEIIFIKTNRNIDY